MKNQPVYALPEQESRDAKIRVLVVDDEKPNVELLQRYLTAEGYEVSVAFNGAEALVQAGLQSPDLILLDVKMPVMDGLTFCEKIRADLTTRSLPIVILTAHNTLEDRLRALRVGVDDFMSKPYDLEEVKERLESTLRRRRWDLASHPLTHLPGSPVIEDEVWKRIRGGATFAFSYIDIDNFKAYNDVYGYEAGDKVIKRLALLLIKAARAAPNAAAFAGHVGGDDFIFIGPIDYMTFVMPDIAQSFDAERNHFYSPEDLARGVIQTKNRQGQERIFPLLSLSVAIISTATRRIAHYARMVEIASELKRFVKTQPHGGHSLVVWDRRTDAPPETH